MLKIENSLYEEGYQYVACVDEVGRGCLFGDVVACAIIMEKGIRIEGVNDSKRLTPKKREDLYEKILEKSIAYGIGRVDNRKIDKINIKASTRLAMKYAVENLKDKLENKLLPDFLMIDAESIDLDIQQKSINKGDSLSHGIACASIVAKVYRDRLCQHWDRDYPGYGIAKHKGYGTKAHIEAIKELGPSELHRNTFLKKILKG